MSLLKTLYKTAIQPFEFGASVATNKTVRSAALIAGGAVIGGPAGAAAGASVASAANGIQDAHEAKKIVKQQLAAQASQANALKEQEKLSASRLNAERKRTEQSLARLSRGRVKGGLFGEYDSASLGASVGSPTLG